MVNVFLWSYVRCLWKNEQNNLELVNFFFFFTKFFMVAVSVKIYICMSGFDILILRLLLAREVNHLNIWCHLSLLESLVNLSSPSRCLMVFQSLSQLPVLHPWAHHSAQQLLCLSPACYPPSRSCEID